MRVIMNALHSGHEPRFEFDGRGMTPAWEVPGRVAAIRTALEAAGGYSFEDAPPIEEAELLRLHDADYLRFLKNAGDAGLPSVFPFGPNPRAAGIKARHGTYCFDTYTPLLAGTWAAALGGASAATHAANLIASGESSVYVLTRPPGHHAERARCGGYSYLNNAALAADRLAKLGRVAILDLDVHHGNGTQHLFYDRDDAFFVSLHGDPANLFPYFSGFADETGAGRGLGFNLNLPLQPESTKREYEPALHVALEAIRRVKPQSLIVSLGTDAHESDPIGGMKLPTKFFGTMGRLVGELKLPTVVVQEGGYNLATAGECVAEFLNRDE